LPALGDHLVAKKLGHDFDFSNNPFITTENYPFLLDYMLI